LNIRLKARGLGELGRATVGTDAVDLVLAPALVAVEAVDEGIGEGLQVARGRPHGGRAEDGGVEADDVARSWTIERHQAFLTLRSMLTPSGP
jgi:hypothetical protein